MQCSQSAAESANEKSVTDCSRQDKTRKNEMHPFERIAHEQFSERGPRLFPGGVQSTLTRGGVEQRGLIEPRHSF